MEKFLITNSPIYVEEKYDKVFNVEQIESHTEILDYIVHSARAELKQKYRSIIFRKKLKGRLCSFC